MIVYGIIELYTKIYLYTTVDSLISLILWEQGTHEFIYLTNHRFCKAMYAEIGKITKLNMEVFQNLRKAVTPKMNESSVNKVVNLNNKQ